MPRLLSTPFVLISLLAIFAPYLLTFLVPIKIKYTVVGFSRPRDQIKNIHGAELRHIPDTPLCEDLHLHEPSGLLFTACGSTDQGLDIRRSWFPPLGLLDVKHSKAQKGSIVVIDPKTFKSTRLELDNFEGPFISHGIDIFSSNKFPNLVYIYAINHLPHPKAGSVTQINKAQSQIEIFSHTIGTTEARRLFSVAHPLITTPNDILASSTTSFYVTNDHYYRSGLMRHVEDFAWRGVAPWTDTVHVTIDTIDKTPDDPFTGINATVALTGLHNNNGIGRGEADDILLIGSAASGELTRVKRDLDAKTNPTLEILEHIQLDTTIDNPVYYHDKYATPGNDASGYILAGMTRAVDLAGDVTSKRPMPVTVWHVKRDTLVEVVEGKSAWTKEIIFQDDGKEISTAATAVLVGIDPKETGGKKKGWLFVTGFLSESVVASLIDL